MSKRRVRATYILILVSRKRPCYLKRQENRVKILYALMAFPKSIVNYRRIGKSQFYWKRVKYFRYAEVVL